MSRFVALVGLASFFWSLGCDTRPFVTAVDLPLQIIALNPADGSENISRNTTIEAAFNLELVASSITEKNFFLEDIGDPDNPVKVDAAVVYSKGDKDTPPLATLSPSELLAYSRQYRVTLTTDIERKASAEQNLPKGNLLQKVTAVFRTIDPPPFLIVATAPGAQSQTAPLDSTFALTFSEPVNCALLDTAVTVTEQFDPHPHTAGEDRTVAGSWSCTEPDSIEETACSNTLCTAVFTPQQAFAYSSHIVVAIQGGSRSDGALESFRATDDGGQLPDSAQVEFDIVDPPPLSMASFSPSASAEQVPRDAAIVVTFSEDLECGTINGNTVSVSTTLDSLRGGTTTPVAGAIDCQDNSFTFTPDTEFDWSAVVDVLVLGGAYDATTYPNGSAESLRATSQGGQLSDTQSLSFRALDPPALAVISTTPAAGATGVERDSNISVVFSEAIDCTTVESAIADGTLTLTELDDAGNSISHTLVVESCSDAELIFNPDLEFTYSGSLTLSLPDTLASLRASSRAGQLVGGFEMSFRTVDPPMLTVVSTLPPAGATGVALDASISVTFSEAIDCATVTSAIDGGTLTVTEVNAASPAAVHTVTVQSCSGAVLVVDTAADYSYSGVVTAVFPDTLTSQRATSRGGELAGGFVLTFRAVDPPALFVNSTHPGGGSVAADLSTDLTVVFSEPIDCTSVSPSTIHVKETLDDSSTVEHTVTVASCSGSTLVLDISLDLQMSSTAVVTLPDSIQSARATDHGGSLENGYSWVFSTSDPPDLIVIHTTPGDGNVLVETTQPIIVRFNEAVDLTTVDESTFVVEDLTAGTTLSTGCGAASDGQAAGTPCSYVATESDTTITFTPGADLDYEHQIRFVLSQAIASDRATSGGGTLTTDLSYTFETIPVPPISVVSVVPRAGSFNIPVQPTIVVEFNQDVLGSTVVLDGADSDVTVWLNPGETPSVSTRVQLDCAGCTSTGTTFSFTPVASLASGSRYTFVIKGNINGVRGAGGSLLIDDYLAAYSVTSNTLIAFTSPADGDTDVSPASAVCATFVDDIDASTVDTDSFVVQFVNDLGGITPLQPDTAGAPPAGFEFSGVDPATGLPDPGYSSNRVCFVAEPTQYGCRDIEELLPANAEIQVNLGATIATTGGTLLTGGWSYSFSTGELPYLVSIGHRNAVGGSGGLADQSEVPVNATFVITFSEPVEAASLAQAISLVRLDDQTNLPLENAVLERDGLVAVVSTQSNMPYLNDLTEGLELRIGGGATGVTTTDGLYIDDNHSARFFTSPRTNVQLSPPVPEIAYEGMVTPAIFDRPMHLPSITTETFYADDTTDANNPQRLTGIVAKDTKNTDTAVHIPVPSYIVGHSVVVTLTAGVMDYLGNPLPQETTITYDGIQSTAQATSYLPDPLDTTNVAPSDGAVVSGGQVFTLTFDDTVARLRNRMLPTSFNDQTILIEETTCPEARGFLPQENRFVLGETGVEDQLQFWSKEYLRSGCEYSIDLVQSEFANLYMFADDSRSNVSFQVTVESQAPSLASTDPSSGAVDVAPDALISAVFSESMNAALFNSASSFTVHNGVNNITGAIEVSDSTAFFLPASPLAGGTTYTVSLGSELTDLAGNTFAGATFDFTVESTPPQVQSIVATSLDSIVMSFDEKVAAASVEPDTTSSNGTVQVRLEADGSTVYGCAQLSQDLTRLEFVPLVSLQSGQSYAVTVTTTLTDIGGTALAADVVQSVVAP